MPFSFFDNSVNNNAGTPGIFQSIAVDRPAANELPVGSLFVDTTNNLIQRTDGTNWVTVGDAGGGTITGGGTIGALAKWSSATALGDAVPGTDYATPGQLASYLPLTGGTLTGTLTGTRITYNTAQARTTAGLAIHNSNAQDVAIFGASGGLNTSFLGTITATSIIRSGGTSAQFLKADGSVDSNTYLTTGSASSTYLPLTGGTLTGSLTATSIIRSGGTASQILAADGSVITAGTNITISGGQINATGGGGITGSGTAGQLTLWDGTSSVTGITTLTYGATTGLLVNPSISAASGIARAQNITTTLTATANSDVLVGLDINPTFTNGAFTAVANAAIRIGGQLFIGQGKGSLASNIVIGSSTSGRNISSGVLNVIIGTGAGNNLTGGNSNTAVGVNALQNVGNSSNNTAVGASALVNNTGNGNTAIGQNAISQSGAGQQNTAIGQSALFTLTSGSGNTAVGQTSMQSISTGGNNTAIGQLSLGSISTSSSNIGVGWGAGRYAGATGTTSNGAATGSVYVGYDTRASASGNSNEIVIAGYTGSGDGQVGLGSNTTVIGNASTTFGRWFGNLLLGTSTNSTFLLDIANGSFRQSGNITASSLLATGGVISPTLIAATNNDTLVALDINPTFTNGAFTSVANAAIRINNQLHLGQGKNNISSNIIFGSVASGRSISSGSNNIAVGINTAINLSTGTHNIFIGNNIGSNQSTQNSNIAIGSFALQSNNGNQNTVIGRGALGGSGNGSDNVAIGFNSLANLSTGNTNTAIGSNAGVFVTAGGSNTLIGANAGQSITGTLGAGNVAVGSSALQATTTASSNTAIGNLALTANTTGANNIAIGQQAGRYFGASGINNNTTGAGNVYIGYDTRASADGNTNEVVIAGYNGVGDGRVGLGTNTTVLGNASTTATRIFGNLWLGTNSGSTSASVPLTLNGTGTNNGSQVLYTNDYATGYTGISADTRGDMSMQTEAAGSGSDKGIKLNTNGNNTRIYVTNNGNIGANTTTQFGAGVLVIGIANATTVPTVNPTGGGVLYVEAGALKYRGSSGTVTTIANA